MCYNDYGHRKFLFSLDSILPARFLIWKRVNFMNHLSLLKLFKGYIGENTGPVSEEGLKYGLLIPASAPKDVFVQAVELYGKDGEKWNQTFHKSWKKLADAPIEQLLYEQLIHYMTTYGFEEFDIFSHERVYIPHERLEIPELEEDIELICIRPYSLEEVSEKLMILLTSGIALSGNTIDCIADLAELVDIGRLEEIQNREARIVLYSARGLAPDDPDEFLRYVIYHASGSTLKIQDKATIDSLRIFSRKELLELFDRYLANDQDAVMRRLASVFLRNKRLFLAMKTPLTSTSCDSLKSVSLFDSYFRDQEDEVKRVNHLINRISKLAKQCHRPLAVNKLDRLTAPSTQISEAELKESLDKITVFREIRIINGLLYALSRNESIVYRIRNGRSFATERKRLDEEGYSLILKRCQIVREHLISRLRPHLEGKSAYLPNDFVYKVPSSEKQFVGNYPCGSSFTSQNESDVIFGIHWTNLKAEEENDRIGDIRVDLDLHMQSLKQSYGWNSAYRNTETNVYYSGDMTDAPAPKGASELFYIGRNNDGAFMFTVNNYTDNRVKIPFETVLAKAESTITEDKMNENYMIDPNDMIIRFPMEMDAGQNMMRMGFVYFSEDSIRVVFDSFSSGRLIVSHNDDPVFRNTFSYMQEYQKTSLALDQLLKECGVSGVDRSFRKEADFDLSPDVLTKETIINILSIKE